MSLFNQQLERSKLNKELLGFWNYQDDQDFWCGYVVDYNETLVKIQHFTKYGIPDGLIVSQITAIKNIDFDDDYAKAMKYVIENANQLNQESEMDLQLSNDENWDFQTLKQLEGNNEIITSLEINNTEYYSGFITKVSDSDIILNCVGKIGQDEGKVIYKIEDVTGFRINDIDNRRRAMLYKWKKDNA